MRLMSSGPSALAAYLAEHEVSVDDFAVIVKAHRSQIYRALSGERRPGLDLAAEIERKTGGAVPATSWRRPSRRSPIAA